MFNGKDLASWHGMPHVDPSTFAALPEAERKAKLETWKADARNLFVREIAPAEANEILRKHGAAGFVEVFNGKDFTGWAGPVENYEVKDGAIVCRPKKGGTIYTKEEFADFVARA